MGYRVRDFVRCVQAIDIGEHWPLWLMTGMVNVCSKRFNARAAGAINALGGLERAQVGKSGYLGAAALLLTQRRRRFFNQEMTLRRLAKGLVAEEAPAASVDARTRRLQPESAQRYLTPCAPSRWWSLPTIR